MGRGYRASHGYRRFCKERGRVGLKRLLWGARCSENGHLVFRLGEGTALSFQPMHTPLGMGVLLKLPGSVPPPPASPAEKPKSTLRYAACPALTLTARSR